MASKKRTVILDMDDVTVKHTDTWIEVFADRTGIRLDKSNWDHWHLNKVLPSSITKQLFSISEEPGFFRHLPPKDGAVRGIKFLLEEGLDLILLTASPAYAYMDKYLWVKENLPFFPVDDNLVLGARKDKMMGDFFVDDAPHNLLSSPADIKIVFDEPWNRHLVQFKRVYHWDGLIKLIISECKNRN